VYYTLGNPDRKFHHSDRMLSRRDLKEIFGSGTIILRHDYLKTRMKRHKKKKEGYIGVTSPKSRIKRIIDL